MDGPLKKQMVFPVEVGSGRLPQDGSSGEPPLR
jgi:hypothetical protein